MQCGLLEFSGARVHVLIQFHNWWGLPLPHIQKIRYGPKFQKKTGITKFLGTRSKSGIAEAWLDLWGPGKKIKNYFYV